jgi:hypothetical protein
MKGLVGEMLVAVRLGRTTRIAWYAELITAAAL